MAAPIFVTLHGLFWELEGQLVVQGDDGEHPLDEALLPAVGREVAVSVHHLPPEPPLLGEPGFGACLWAGHCPCGHNEDPGWLFSASYEGVLGRASDGTWLVGDEVLPVRKYMPGHLGRLVLFAEGVVDPDASVDELIDSAASLAEMLKSLKDSLE